MNKMHMRNLLIGLFALCGAGSVLADQAGLGNTYDCCGPKPQPCPPVNCKPRCENPCLVAGFFTAQAIEPVQQVGCNFVVSYIGPAGDEFNIPNAPESVRFGLYSIMYNRPFCHDVAITALSSTAAGTTTFPVRVICSTKSHAVVVAQNNAGVSFIAMPVT